MTSNTAWFYCTEPGVTCRLMSFNCPGAWSLQCVTDSAALVQHTQGAGSGDSCLPRGAGPAFAHLPLGRKVMMDFMSLTHRFVIKCQILSEAIQVSHHPCFSESKIIAILGNHPVASCFYQHSSACLSSFTSLFTTGGTFWRCR